MRHIEQWQLRASNNCPLIRYLNATAQAASAYHAYLSAPRVAPFLAASPCHDAEAVMFDFVQAVSAGRRSIGRAGKAGLNDAGKGRERGRGARPFRIVAPSLYIDRQRADNSKPTEVSETHAACKKFHSLKIASG